MLWPLRIAALSVALLGAVGIGGADDAAGNRGNLSGSLTFEHDRDAAARFGKAREHLAAGQTAAGLSGLQELLDRDVDVLIENDGGYVSVWEAANHVLAGLSPGERADYERLAADASRHEFERASDPVDRDRLARLTIRYRHAAVGREAAVLLAALAFDHGDRDAASDWRDLVVRIADAAALPRNLRRLSERLEGFDRRAVTNAPIATGDLPATAASVWSVELDVAPKAARAVDLAVAEFDAQALTPVLAARPLLVEDRIITRTLTGLVCVDAASGEVLWTQEAADHASRLAHGPGELTNPVRRGQVSATLLRRLIRDSLQDELASDGEVVYVVSTARRPDDAKASEPTNTLRAVEIATGKTKWELGPQQIPKKRFAKRPEPRFFLGPPLVDGGQRLVLAQRRQTVELVALDAADGATLWSVPVGQSVRDLWAPEVQGEGSPPWDRERQSTACRLSRGGSRVLCSTAAGALVCVDTLSRRLLWAHRYARGDLPRQPPEKGDATHFREMPIRDSFARAECWQAGGVGVCVAPDADRIIACDLDTGQRLWSRPRRDGLQLLPDQRGGLILAGQWGVRSLRFGDGEEQWFTQTPRPAGTGIITNDAFVLPLEAGGFVSVKLADGTVIDAPRSEESDRSLTIASHPPTGLQRVDLRNLQANDQVIVSQSPTSLERISLTPTGRDEPVEETASRPPLLKRLSSLRSDLESAIDAVRRIDSRVMLADRLLLVLLERAGLRESVEEQAATLVRRIERSRSADDVASANEMRRRLEALHPDHLYVTTGDGLHSCRLDRWVDGLMQRGGNSAEAPGSPVSTDGVGEDAAAATWPLSPPTVTEKTTHFGERHFLLVPMQVDDESSWRDVTVEMDRLGRMVQFSDADCIVPMAVSLPAEVGVVRAETDFLQAWGVGEVLLVRVGLELAAFERRADGELPDAPLWPARRNTLSLAGPNPPLATAIRPVAEPGSPAWNATDAGREDVFGRRVGEVGPVCADYFCYQERGHLIAREMRSGRELWRRSRLPIGTWAIGDERQVVLFREDSPVVTVLDAFDGRVMGSWRVDETTAGPVDTGATWFAPQLVNGTAAVLTLPTGEGLELRCVDMSNGQTVWQRDVTVGAEVFAVSRSRLGVVEPSGAGRVAVTFVDWRSGEDLSRHELDGPEELADVVTFRDAEQMYVIASGKITDLRLLNARQIFGGAGRRPVNGWLHAFDGGDGEFRWSQRVENMAFPIVQPRHVPLLIINDQLHPADQSIPQGRLIGLDKRTGRTVVSITDSLHINYSLEPDVVAGEIDIRMRGRTLRLEYRAEEPPR